MDVVEDILKQPGLAEEIKDINSIPKGKSVINIKELRDNLRDAVQAGTDVDVSQILKDSHTAELVDCIDLQQFQQKRSRLL